MERNGIQQKFYSRYPSHRHATALLYVKHDSARANVLLCFGRRQLDFCQSQSTHTPDSVCVEVTKTNYCSTARRVHACMLL
jgi:hypothetical protein